MDRWRVHKFGGSSVADAACMQRVADIIDKENGSRLGVVLSACRGVTDALLALITQAERQQPVDDAVVALRERHVEMARTLTPGHVGRRLHRSPRSRLPGHHRHPARRSPDAFGIACGPRSGRPASARSGPRGCSPGISPPAGGGRDASSGSMRATSSAWTGARSGRACAGRSRAPMRRR